MKNKSILFLKLATIIIGISALAVLIRFPQTEGRNINADLFTIYFRDPFLVYIYLGAMPFFIALYQAFKFWGYIGADKAFSGDAVRALRKIKYCAWVSIGFLVTDEIFIVVVNRGRDDIAGGVFMGILLSFAAAVIATTAAVFEKLFQEAIDKIGNRK